MTTNRLDDSPEEAIPEETQRLLRRNLYARMLTILRGLDGGGDKVSPRDAALIYGILGTANEGFSRTWAAAYEEVCPSESKIAAALVDSLVEPLNKELRNLNAFLPDDVQERIRKANKDRDES